VFLLLQTALVDGIREELIQLSILESFVKSKSFDLCSLQIVLRTNAFESLKDPKTLLTKSWEQNQEKGSSTFVVVTLPEDEAKIYSSYVGDSGYCILRPDDNKPDKFDIVFASQSQQRRFNHPFQLGWANHGDHPEVASSFSHDVKDGDLVILGTDGLFDNLAVNNVVFLANLDMPDCSRTYEGS
jgi:serine/threonine protein phosphatase PrpC